MPQESDLSVLISAYKNDPLTLVHVRECMSGTVMPKEIIVVNDGGPKELEQKLKELPRYTTIIYARVDNDIPWNYTGARNLGVWLSTGQYLSIEDNDHIPHPDFYKQALDVLEARSEVNMVRTRYRTVITEKQMMELPQEQWEAQGTRPPHQDVAVIRRALYLKCKGYDERFAGAYGWSATDWKRRTLRAGKEEEFVGTQYVMQTPKTPGLSSRNWQMARRQRHHQSPRGILNYTYEYAVWSRNT